MTHRRGRRGVLLVEAMIAAVVLAVAAVGIATLLTTADAEAAVTRRQARAVALARQLSEEIAAKPLGTDAGPSSAAPARADLTTVAEYAGYADATAGLAAADGTPVAFGGEAYVRQVTVTFGAGPAGTPAADVAAVTVTVTPPAGSPVSITQLVFRGDRGL